MRPFRSIIVVVAWLLFIAASGYLSARFLHGVDVFLYNALVPAPKEEVVLLSPGDRIPTHRVLTPRSNTVYPQVYAITWESSLGTPSDQCSLQELATILYSLSTHRGVQLVGLSAAPEWVDTGNPTVLQMLHHSLKHIRHLRLGLQTDNTPHAQPVPQELLPLAIPPDNVQGDISLLPSANSYTAVRQLPGDVQAAFKLSPDYARDELSTREQAQQRGLSMPLLMRWGEHVFPTLSLQLAMDALGISPKDIKLRPGKSLQFGQRILPLDATGRTPLGAARAVQLPLSAVLVPPESGAPTPPSIGNLHPCAIITRPSTATLAAGDRGEGIAATLSVLLAQVHRTFSPQELPIPARLLRVTPLQCTLPGLLALGGACLAALLLLPRLPAEFPWLLRTTLLLAWFICVLVLATLWYRAGMWMSLCAWMICGLELIVAQEWIRRSRNNRSLTIYD